MTEQPPLRFLIYSRTNDGSSGRIAEQSRACALLVRSIGGVVAYEVADFGSAMKTARLPGYKRMLEAINSGQVDVIIAADMERLGRDIAGLHELFSLCAQHDIEIWDASTASRFDDLRESMVTTTDDDVPPTLH